MKVIISLPLKNWFIFANNKTVYQSVPGLLREKEMVTELLVKYSPLTQSYIYFLIRIRGKTISLNWQSGI